MNKIKAKLKSKRGVSLMLALLLFLVCALSGAAAITAAGTNVGRYAYLREYQQQYLSISSAAKLLKEQFKDGVGITATCSGGSAIYAPPNNDVYKLLQNEMQMFLYRVYDPTYLYVEQEAKFDVTVDGDDSFKDVNVAAKFKAPQDSGKSTIEVELSCEGYKLKFSVELTFKVTGNLVEIEKAEVDRITLPGK